MSFVDDEGEDVIAIVKQALCPPTRKNKMTNKKSPPSVKSRQSEVIDGAGQNTRVLLFMAELKASCSGMN